GVRYQIRVPLGFPTAAVSNPLIHVDERARIADRVRTPDNRIEQCKYAGIQTDAEGEREDRRDREDRSARACTYRYGCVSRQSSKEQKPVCGHGMPVVVATRWKRASSAS